MTVKQYVELLEYINKNNGWGENMYENNVERKRNCFKYVNATFDTRYGDIWYVKLREGFGCDEKAFRVETEEEIQKLYDFLDKRMR